MDIKVGDKVKVKPHWNWPDGAMGTIRGPLFPSATEDDGMGICEGCLRTIETEKGSIAFVYVEFESSIEDGDGDGPYPAGEVEVEYVELL